MGAAIGAIGRPYVEYFSDPFIIGLEDENANLLYHILRQMGRGGLEQHFYVFNTGGLGADTNDQASGRLYKKISRELTLMLQEAVLRNAIKFEYDATLGSDIAVAIVDRSGQQVMDLRQEWLPRNIYGEADYARRVVELRRRRYFGRDADDKAGILRYTRVANDLLDITDIPAPTDERQLAWLLSFYWGINQSSNSLTELTQHLGEGQQPAEHLLRALGAAVAAGVEQGLDISGEGKTVLGSLRINV